MNTFLESLPALPGAQAVLWSASLMPPCREQGQFASGRGRRSVFDGEAEAGHTQDAGALRGLAATAGENDEGWAVETEIDAEAGAGHAAELVDTRANRPVIAEVTGFDAPRPCEDAGASGETGEIREPAVNGGAPPGV